MDIKRRFQKNWERQFARLNEKKILLAVSGGVDSMVMAELVRRCGLEAVLAHCNFSLRGADSDADEALVKDYAATHGLDFYSVRFDTRAEMARLGRGLQETARILRYAWLEQVRAGSGCAVIATAHHAGDNAETVLMHLFRGTGISGLHGIVPDQDGQVIRPLLFAEKSDLYDYAGEAGVPYREDASNQTDAYERNALRLHVMPVIAQFYPGAVKAIHETAGRVHEAEQLYREAVTRIINKLIARRGKDIYVPVRKLRSLPQQQAVAFELFSGYGFKPAQIAGILELCDSESGRFIQGRGYRVVRHRDFLVIVSDCPPESGMHLVGEQLPATVYVAEGSFEFRIAEKDKDIPAKDNEVLADLSALQQPLVLRRWRTGDYFYPLGMGMKKKKLSRFFIDRKIPVHEKEHVWVLESGKRIVWVAGMRLDERFRVKSDGAPVLHIRYSRDSAGGAAAATTAG